MASTFNEYELELEQELQHGAEYSVIIGPGSPGDGRFPIPARARRPSSLLFPTNSICLIQLPGGGTGTGTLIAPQVVLTAKHVLAQLNPRPPRCSRTTVAATLRARARVTPGADLSATTARRQRPATPGSMVVPSTRFRVHPTLDFGVIILPRPFLRPNRFMMLQPRGSINTATLLTIAGYPCDKPLGTMWGHSAPIPLVGVTPTHLHYTIDTCPGHSGSPIWLLGNNGIRLLLGIHTNGITGQRCQNDPTRTRCLRTGAPVTPVAGTNCGVRVTCEVIRQIQTWCRSFGVRGPAVDQPTFRRVCR